MHVLSFFSLNFLFYFPSLSLLFFLYFLLFSFLNPLSLSYSFFVFFYILFFNSPLSLSYSFFFLFLFLFLFLSFFLSLSCFWPKHLACAAFCYSLIHIDSLRNVHMSLRSLHLQGTKLENHQQNEGERLPCVQRIRSMRTLPPTNGPLGMCHLHLQ